MKVCDLFEMTLEEVKQVPAIIQDMFSDICKTFCSDHFMDRMTDGNIDKSGKDRGKQIISKELMFTLHRMRAYIVKHKLMSDDIDHYGVFIDKFSNLNIVARTEFRHGRKDLIIITIMKHKDFKFQPDQESWIL